MNEMRKSNGIKAMDLAAEHVARIENEMEAAHRRIDELETEVAHRDGRIAELTELINRLEQQMNRWMLKATAIAQTLLNASAVLVNGGREAQDIISEVKHGEMAETLRTNGSEQNRHATPPA